MHSFIRTRFGYLTPEEKYIFCTLENDYGEVYDTCRVDDIQLIDLYKQVQRGGETRESLLGKYCHNFAPKIHFVLDYFEKPQEEDLAEEQRLQYHKHASSRTH